MPSPQRIGYNIDAEHAGSDRQAVADAQIGMQSTVTLILDDHKSGWFFSKQIAARSPSTLRICRTFMRKDANGGWDGNINEAPDGNSETGFLSAVNYVNFLQNLNAPAGTIHQIFCEPAMHGARVRAKNKWQIEVMRELSRRGMRGCFDNIQTVLEDLQVDIDAGDYDDLWYEMSLHPEHLYGIHEYAKGDLWFNTSKAGMLRLTERNKVSTDFLALPDDVLKAAYVANPLEAHLGRCEIIARRCAKIKRPDGTIGIPVPKTVYTEIGWDDVRITQKDAVDNINGRVAMGFPTMAQYWHIRYPDWSWAEAAKEQIKWLNRAMPDYIIGACLFGFDTAFENGKYHLEQSGENGLQALLKRMADEWRTTPTQTPPVPVPVPPTPTPQPTPPTEPHAWQKQLTEAQRSIYSRAKAGELARIDETMVRMGELLDEAHALIATLQARKS